MATTEEGVLYFQRSFEQGDVIRTTNFLRLGPDNATGGILCAYAWHISRKQWYLYLFGPVISGARDQLKKLLDGLVEFNSRGEITRIVSSDIEKTSTHGGSGKFFITNTTK